MTQCQWSRSCSTQLCWATPALALPQLIDVCWTAQHECMHACMHACRKTAADADRRQQRCGCLRVSRRASHGSPRSTAMPTGTHRRQRHRYRQCAGFRQWITQCQLLQQLLGCWHAAGLQRRSRAGGSAACGNGGACSRRSRSRSTSWPPAKATPNCEQRMPAAPPRLGAGEQRGDCLVGGQQGDVVRAVADDASKRRPCALQRRAPLPLQRSLQWSGLRLPPAAS